MSGISHYTLDGIKIKEMEEKNTKIGSFDLEVATKEANEFIDSNPWLKEMQSDRWIQTYTGKKFYPLYPKEEDISIMDIAHALSMLCRFTGHCEKFISVAQHSVSVSYLCDRQDRLYGLLHDASEAYISDISSVVKKFPQLSGYKEIEKNIQETICRKFGLPTVEPESVKIADQLMLGVEAKSLLKNIHPDWSFPIDPPPFQIVSLTPAEAKSLFLNRFNELNNEKS